MLNLILCECKKFKRRQIFILATLAAFIFPIIITALFWNTPDPDFENLFAGIVDYGDFLLLLPILVIVASSMFFTEQDNGTLKKYRDGSCLKKPDCHIKAVCNADFGGCLYSGWLSGKRGMRKNSGNDPDRFSDETDPQHCSWHYDLYRGPALYPTGGLV